MKRHIVSVRSLKSLSACSLQIKLFQELFGASTIVTRKKLLLAAANGLDVEYWFRKTFPLLDDDYYAKRKPLDDDYRAKCANLIADMIEV